MKNKFLKISLVIIFISFFILFNWNSFSAPFERDEGEYAYSAWLMRTDRIPYQDSFLQKPPLIIYTYLMGQYINPISVWPPRFLASIFTLFTAFLIYLIAKKEWGVHAGIFAVFLFISLVHFPPLTPFAANTEKFMLLPLVSLLALFVYYKDSNKNWPYVLAGISATLAIFYKPISLPVVLFIILFWLFKIYRLDISKKISNLLRPFFLILSSSIILSFILLIPFLKVLPNLFQESIIFNLSYASVFDNPFSNLLKYLGKFLHYWWILLFLLLGFVFEKPKNIFYYFLLLIISILTIFSTPIGHYYLIIMPFLALCCASLFDSLLNSLAKNEKQKTISTIIFLPIILFIMIIPFKEQFSFNPQQLSIWMYGTVNPFSESQEVAKHLKEITKDDDLVFVAGSEPQIYYYAQRKSISRFIITYPLNMPTPYREEYQKELMSEFEKNPPKAIILSTREISNLWDEKSPKIFINYFNDLISKNYNIIGGYVWETNEKGHWQEPLDPKLLQNASLILLSKK
ncbi:MAG: glycosyltransferase family 39 protein [Burkholderiales bacterium]|nr:glycosyltransferase family 39 protein [Burkholderiales bacterium]